MSANGRRETFEYTVRSEIVTAISNQMNKDNASVQTAYADDTPYMSCVTQTGPLDDSLVQ